MLEPNVQYSGPSDPVAIDTEPKAAATSGYAVDNADLAMTLNEELGGIRSRAAAGEAQVDLVALNRAIMEAFVSRPTRTARASYNGTEACLYGGTFSANIVYAAPEAVTTGDNGLLTFADCGLWTTSGTVYLTGRMSYRYTAVTGDVYHQLYDWSFTQQAVYDDLYIAGNSYLMVDGDATSEVAGTWNNVNDIRLTGGTFALTSYAADFLTVDGRHRMTNFDLTFNFDMDTGVTTAGADMTMASSDIDGEVTIQTHVPFWKRYTSYPSEGELEVTGADGSSVYLTVVNETDGVLLDIDTDGDGVYDIVGAPKTWAELNL